MIGDAKTYKITGTISAEKTLNAMLSSTVYLTGQAEAKHEIDIPVYEDTYEVTPKTGAQTLYTKGKRLADDISIDPIPYQEVSNPKGGNTVTIG